MRSALTAIFFLLFLSGFSATLRGRITDAKTGEELVGAYVFIKELKIGASVGLDGTYTIKNIPEGNYTLQCSLVSYMLQEIPLSVSSASSDLVQHIALKSLQSDLEEVTVTASRDMGSENSARNSEREATNIINVVSAKAIELSPDLNVANVIQRMSGITLDKSAGNGAQYALLRGMDKRYNYTLINGIKMPSTNSKHRYVPLDIFPADLVDRIEVTKAITADMEGDAIAGTVNLIMKNAPDKLLIQANASGGFSQFSIENTQQTFNKSAVHRQSPFETHATGYEAKPSDFSSDNLDLSASSVPANYLAGLTLGNRFFNHKLGVLISGNYQNINRGSRSILFDDDLSRDGNNLPVVTSLQDRTYFEVQQNYGLHAKLDYRLNSRHQLKLYLADIRYTTSQIRSEDETSLNTSYAPEQGYETRTHSDRLRLNLQELVNTTLQGEHVLLPGLSANWSAVYSAASNHSPDEATITYATSLENFKQVQGFVDFDGSTRRWRYNNDQDKAGYANLKYAFKAGAAKLEISGGGLYRRKTRTSFYNSYTLVAYSPYRSKDSALYSAKGVDWNKYSEILWTVRNPRGSVGTSENFDATENVLAYYGMARISVAAFQIIAGLRVENTEQGYSMLFRAGEKRPEEQYTYRDVLPNLHIKYSINGKHNIRAAYYRATNKPGFQEIVPYIVRGDDYSSAGNPDLKQAVADNADLRWEYYPNRLDQIMAGLFYKNIRNAIEYAFVDYLGNSHEQVYSPVNSDVAVNYGLELDFTKYRRQWGIKANYTWTSSNITTNKLSRIKTAKNQDSTIYIEQTRPLFGQSAHVGNISLLYLGATNGLSAQLAFSYTGERLYTVSRYINNDLWQKGFWQLDFSAEKRFKRGFSVFAKAQNLLNTRVTVFIKNTNPENNNKPYHDASDKTTLVRSEYSKPSYLAGIRFKF